MDMEPVKITSFTDVHGIGIVCKDIEKKIENYVKYLGVDPAKVRLFDTQKNVGRDDQGTTGRGPGCTL